MTPKTKTAPDANGQTAAMRILDEYVYGTSRFMEIPVEKLHIDMSYQRDQTEQAVAKIVGKFDANQAGPPTVNKRPDGSLYIVDGGHRLEAAKLMGTKTLTCRIISIPVEDEAALCIALNKNTVRFAPVQYFKANIRDGNPAAVEIARILAERDLRIGASHSPQVIGCVGALLTLYRKRGTVGLAKVIDTTLGAWPSDEPRRFAGQILNGIDVFYETHPRADSDRLISRLSCVTTSHLLGKGSGRWHAWKSLDQRGGSLIDATAEEIAILYNKTRSQ